MRRGVTMECLKDDGKLPEESERLDNSGNGREENRKTFLEEPGWNWIKITLLVWRQIYEFKNFDVSGRSKRGKVRWKRWWRW